MKIVFCVLHFWSVERHRWKVHVHTHCYMFTDHNVYVCGVH